MQNEPRGKELARIATCPFCGLPLERPKELDIKRPGDMPVGSCVCGAVYAHDATGHNLGAAFAEALVFAANMDWDLAWNLLPEEDYQDGLVKDYDLESNLIVPGGTYEGRRVNGALYFIRMHNEIQEATAEGVQRKLENAKPATPASTSAGLSSEKAFNRKQIEDMVRDYQVESLLSIASQDKRVLRELQRLLYSGDELMRMRNAEIIGKVSAIIAKSNPGTISRLLQKLVSSVSDYGTSVWGAIDTAGEIISTSPNLFIGYLPTLYQLLEEEVVRHKAMRAIGKVAAKRPDLVQKPFFFFTPFLADRHPATRAYSALVLGLIGATAAKADLEKLTGDKQEFDDYEQGNIIKRTVCQLVEEALAKLTGQK
jgi:hypothetical protein